MVVDNVTGKVVTDGSWNVGSHTFGNVDTPVVDGYHADSGNLGPSGSLGLIGSPGLPGLSGVMVVVQTASQFQMYQLQLTQLIRVKILQYLTTQL